MMQPNAQGLVKQTHYILIVDDSQRLRFALADLIVAACVQSGKGYRVFHADKDGKYTQSSESIASAVTTTEVNGQTVQKLEEFAIYTAPSPKHALFVINSPLFTQLTIISDVMMPADTQVGLIGMLENIARRNLSVNLLFASSDAQNRVVIARLVESGKAYFAVKASGLWEQIAHALVFRTDSLSFKKITPADFSGVQNATQLAMGANQPLTAAPSANYTPQPAYAPTPAQVAPASAPVATQSQSQIHAGTGRTGVVAPPRPATAAPQPATPVPTHQATPRPAETDPKPGGFFLFRPFMKLFRSFRGSK
jgi:CheY-like chemotaxis protein